MGESAVKSAASWLGNVLAQEIVYLGGVTGKVETLQRELNMLASFIEEAVKTRRQDARVQTAVTLARSLAYDCEDVIDTYILKLARHGYEQYDGGCQLGSALRWACILREARNVHDIRSQIDDLNCRISTLKTDLLSYGVTARINQDDIPGSSDAGPVRRVYPHEREERVVVGLEHDVEELVGRLVDPTDKRVIVITGMGGLGKSTLASELYHHPKIRKGGYFQAFGWASASQRLQPKQVLQTILYSLVDEKDHDGRAKIDRYIQADRGHAALYEMMNRVKCVVVVDDIWTSGDWAQLQAAFPRKTANGSRVILTTRNQNILSSLDQDHVHLHPIKGLDEANSWKLFQITAFVGGTCTDAAKERLGRKIIRHCKGVPLAIVVVGKALKMKERVEDWEQMHNNITAQIKRGGAPHKPYKEVYDVLQVSYDELPQHLKKCFLHLSYYPEDFEFIADKMKDIWNGGGIVIKEHPNNISEDEEEICERYLEELVSRNIVQVEGIWPDGTIMVFRMHDLMRDVCIDIAKREGSFQTINCQSIIPFRDSLPLPRDKGLRSLAVYISIEHQHSTLTRNSFVKEPSRAPNLRSLFFFTSGERKDEVDCTRIMETICEDYPLLRVFDCQGLNMTGKLPKKLGNLIHLRYLNIDDTHITELPSSIQKLQSLQTLRLEVNGVVENLVIPNVLWKMKQLTHVHLPRPQSFLFMIQEGKRITASDLQRYSVKGGGVLKLDGLCKLSTLDFIDLDRTDIKDSSTLERLKIIDGSCESNTELLHLLLQLPTVNRFFLTVHAEIINEDPSTLSRCQALIVLNLYAEPYANIHLRQPLQLPNSLIRIEILFVQFDEDPLPVLEKLPHLSCLSLCRCYDGQKMACSASGFPQLTFLDFDGLPQFSTWEVEQGALQKLKDLYIYDCALTQLPDAIPDTAIVHTPPLCPLSQMLFPPARPLHFLFNMAYSDFINSRSMRTASLRFLTRLATN